MKSELIREEEMIDFENARLKYKPEVIKFLLIAEAPPKIGSNRFFYFEDVNEKDTLFIETMKVIYPDEDFSNTKNIRSRKKEFLEKFKYDGFYLIDASDKPIESKGYKKKQIKESLPSLIQKIKSLISSETKIILISKTVYEVCFDKIKSEGFKVINRSMIPFPIGFQGVYRKELSELTKQYL
jgi:hypothetical protein